MGKNIFIKALLLSIFLTLLASTYAFAETEGTLTGDSVNVRTSPDLSSTVIDQYNIGQKVSIVSKEGDWYKIILPNQSNAYIFAQYVKPIDVNKIEPQEVKEINVIENKENSDIRTEIITYAKKFLGNPYRYGGTSLTNGTDCSGFTQQVFKNFGYSLNRSSYSQINNGQATTVSQLLPGDLVFFGYGGRISHVAIYIGDNKIIHASTPSTGIVIGNLYDRGNKPFLGCRKII